MTSAYVVITAMYAISFVLSRGVHDVAALLQNPIDQTSPLKDLRLAFVYVWQKPVLMGAMALAFLVNLLAFPFSLGLLPYVAKNIYLTNQTGLGFLGASFALGGLLASMTLSTHRFKLRAAQTMLLSACAWFILDFAVCRLCAKLVHDTFGGCDVESHNAGIPWTCDGDAHVGHLGFADWLIDQWSIG